MTTATLVPSLSTVDERAAYWMLGGRYTILTSGEETDGRLTVVDVVVTPMGGPPLHVHEREDEAFLVLDGDVTVIVGDREIPATAGSYVLGPRGVPHTFRVEGGRPAHMLVICSPAGFDDFVASLGTPAGEGLPAAPDGPPDLDRVMRIAGEHGIRFVPPAG
jgi:mannose-6-phosphate isomerase-like protein (cupin superfamily)